MPPAATRFRPSHMRTPQRRTELQRGDRASLQKPRQIDTHGNADSVDAHGQGGGTEAVVWADLPDAALIVRLRIPATSVPTDRQPPVPTEQRTGAEDPRVRRKRIREAAAELRRRHFSALLDYARLCAADKSAPALALESFHRAVRDIRTAPDTAQPPPHHLFLLVQQTAELWAGTVRRGEVAADFLEWLDRKTHTVPAHPTVAQPTVNTSSTTWDISPTTWAFHQLPERTQAILWHTVVQQRAPAETGRTLGIAPESLPDLRQRALEQLRHVCLRVHAELSGNEQCRHFSSLLDVSTRSAGACPGDGLEQHLATCPVCSQARSQLAGLHEQPDATLAEALLPWAGAAYAAAARRHAASVSRVAPAPAQRGLRRLAHAGPAASITAAAGFLVAAAAVIHLPVHGHSIGAAGPVSAVPTPESSPHPTRAPLPSSTEAGDFSDTAKPSSNPADNGADKKAHPYGDGRAHQPVHTPDHAGSVPHRSAAPVGPPASAHAHGQLHAAADLDGGTLRADTRHSLRLDRCRPGAALLQHQPHMVRVSIHCTAVQGSIPTPLPVHRLGTTKDDITWVYEKRVSLWLRPCW